MLKSAIPGCKSNTIFKLLFLRFTQLFLYWENMKIALTVFLILLCIISSSLLPNSISYGLLFLRGVMSCSSWANFWYISKINNSNDNSILNLTSTDPKFISVYTFLKNLRFCHKQKQPFIGLLIEMCSENMQQTYRRTPMPNFDFNKFAKELYWNHTLARVFFCKFAAYFQNTFL